MTSDAEWFEAQCIGLKRDGAVAYTKEQYQQKYLESVGRVLDELSGYKVPLTIVHGDLNPINIFRPGSDGKYRFFDYAYTCLSFPFFDAVVLCDVCIVERTELKDYLSLWTGFEKLDKLEELVALVRKVRSVIFEVSSFQEYKNSEDCGRRFLFKELQYPVTFYD